MKTALTIAGYDPSGWAGVTADLSTFEGYGVNAIGAVAALTAQNRSTVDAILPVAPAFLEKELTALLREFKPDAVKIGMLGGWKNVRAVRKMIVEKRLKNVVLDPVLRSTSGHALIDKRGVKELLRLLPHSTVVTPNMDEASVLAAMPVKTLKDMEDAAKKIFWLGPRYVVIKGGHLKGAPADILYDGKKFTRYEGARLKGTRATLHGTGCIFSSALAAGLAKGYSVRKSVEGAKRHIEETLKRRRYVKA